MYSQSPNIGHSTISIYLGSDSHSHSSDLDEEVQFFAGPMSKRQILVLMNDHLTHHRGQMIVYVRLKGVKPPAYKGW